MNVFQSLISHPFFETILVVAEVTFAGCVFLGGAYGLSRWLSANAIRRRQSLLSELADRLRLRPMTEPFAWISTLEKFELLRPAAMKFPIEVPEGFELPQGELLLETVVAGPEQNWVAHVLLFPEKHGLPDLLLKPASTLARWTQASVRRPVKLHDDSAAAFEKKFLLLSRTPETVETAIDHRLIEFCLENPQLRAEVVDKRLLVGWDWCADASFRMENRSSSRNRLSPEDWPAFLQTASEFARLLQERSDR
jgi:hypothetical protein